MNNPVSDMELRASLEGCILSASGWRKVFAASGAEEDSSPEISSSDQALCAHFAGVFSAALRRRYPAKKNITIALGTDSRPTGPALADALGRAFLASGIEVAFVGVAAAPEIMAYARAKDGFAYVSASHNPIGHNGVKFGWADGGVIPAADANPLAEALRAACSASGAALAASALLSAPEAAKIAAMYASKSAFKADCLEAYRLFSLEVLTLTADSSGQLKCLDALRERIAASEKAGKPLSILADFNGSARTVSIDRDFFTALGVHFFAINDSCGHIAHRIVPEGESLSWCAREMERMRAEGKTAAERSVFLGFVPDCDGDRGNIVYIDDKTGKAVIPGAQEVFALSVLAEITGLVESGTVRRLSDGSLQPPVAIAVNDPTSLRIEALAAALGAEVFRAEVGEANVVSLARELREKGYCVRILGEGSNGGTITHPAAVRDPLNTLCALIKLLLSTSNTAGETLSAIAARLPPFVTTAVYESDAILKIRTMDHAILKRNYQSLFVRDWAIRRSALNKKYGIASWQAFSYNGTVETADISDFGLSGKGGLKVQFYSGAGKAIAYMWMRGSGTEPVFRILCDAQGSDSSFERELLAWQTALVLEADSKI